MKKNKLLILTPSLKLPGGVSNYINLLKEYLDEDRYEIKYLFVGKTGIFWRDIIYPILVIIQFYRLKRILKEFQPDIIHINPSLTSIAIFRDFIFLNSLKKQKYPVLFLIHGWQDKISDRFQKIFWRNYFKNKFEMADAIVVLANKFKKKLIDLGIKAEKIYVSSTMVDSIKYLPKDKNFLKPYKILFCANIKQEKGPFEILESAPIVLNKFPDTKFIFIGKGKDLEKLKEKSKLMKIEKNVVFTGYLPIEKKINIFKESHIFIFPSLHGEGFPTVILEAMAAGLPVITTPVAGLADAIEDYREGLILKDIPPKPNEIAENLIKLLENPELMKKICINNLKRAKEEFDISKISGKIISIYDTILKNYNK
jgi:glycosyltransferase involved in cell wall biosynthesis